MFVKINANSCFKKSADVLKRTYATGATKYDDYNVWQRSKIPTMHFQASLPRLSIPKLEQTCERYLAAQKPLLIKEAYQKTESNVKHFKETVGQQLQAILVAKDKRNKHTSYITEPWFDMYLKDRVSLPINYNPMLVFVNNPQKAYNDQLIKTTNLLISSLRFHNSLKLNILEPEVYHMNPKKSDNETFRSICSKVPSKFSWYAAYLFKAFPLDMSQYYNLFNSTRIPEIDKDRIVRDPNAKHVLVQHKGHFYTFDVFDNNGNILPRENLMAKLDFILKNNVNEKENEFPIGPLTTLNRDTWATLRHELQNTGNDHLLKKIDGAFINICLDHDEIGNNPYDLTRKYLHSNGKNRWFDKSLSLIVTKDGVGGVNFEHSWGDGVAVLRYFQDIYKDSLTNPQVHPDTKTSTITANDVQKLDFNLNDKLKTEIKQAIKDYENWCNSMDINFIEYDGFGKNLCKKQSISPDAIMQLGFQAAYYKQYGKFVPTYESCSTAAFKHGRTETMRPCTAATKEFCEIMLSKNRPSNATLKEVIKKCSNTHNQLTKDAAMGQGFDRHLFALRKTAEENNFERLNMFEDPAYVSINKNILSTSTLSSPTVWAGGFGPVVQNGLGIAYMIRDDTLGVLATTYANHCNGKDFISSFNEVMNDFKDILCNK